MPLFTKIGLSAAVNGRNILIAQVASPGTLIHAAIAGVAGWDELVLEAANLDAVDRTLTLEWGGVANPIDRIVQLIPFRAGLVTIARRISLQNGLEIRAFADAANVININGSAIRVS